MEAEAPRVGKYYTRVSGRQIRPFAEATAVASWRADSRSRVQLTTNCTGEVRARKVLGGRLYGWEGTEAARAAALEGPQDLLVYNDKLQHRIFEVGSKGSRRRPESLSRYGKNTVREAGAMIEMLHGRDVAFVTLTLPGSTAEAIKAAADRSGALRNGFLQRVRHVLNVRDYIWVWEYQHRGALHAHIAIACGRGEPYQQLKANSQRWWRQLVEHHSDESGVDLFGKAEGGTWRGVEHLPRVECKRVKKSIARYMAKYLSKGPGGGDGSERHPPARWWSVSDSLMEKLKAERKVEVVTVPTAGLAEDLWERVASRASELACKSMVSRNPFSDDVCGTVHYFDDGTAGAVWAELVALMVSEAQIDPEPERPPPLDDFIAAAVEMFDATIINLGRK